MLLTIPDVLDAEQLTQARQLLAQVPGTHWQSGLLTAGSQAGAVKNNEQLALDNPASVAVSQMVLAALEKSPLFFSAALPRRLMPPRINRHEGHTNAYGLHVDQSIRVLGGDQRIRTDISCTVFLSDPEAYDGGELSIQDTFGEHDIKLPAGHAVIYPGTSLHQVMPVTRGCRLACFFWIESMVRSDEQRRLLYNMDQALSALRTQGESPATVQLTGTYHNLLRMWAQT